MQAFDENFIPASVSSIHLTAICGTGMGALAGMLSELGYKVTGSDENVYPPMSTFLESKKIPVFKGFAADNLNPRPDLVIIGNAVRRENPEAQAVFEQKIPFCSMPQAINALVATDKKKLVVTGTHGKTTTSSMLAWALYRLGFDPGFMIGGIIGGFNSNFRIGNGSFFVIEGDEYDTAFFDKLPKFYHYPPYRAIITSVEFDHADIYNSIDDITSVFKTFIQQIPEDGTLFYCKDGGIVDDISNGASCLHYSYGRKAGAFWHVSAWAPVSGGVSCTINKGDDIWASGELPVIGGHNVENLISVCAVLDSLGVNGADAFKALSDFKGVKRRQELRGVERGIRVIDDFAHHPTAVKETISAVKPHCEGRLIAVFEPRTNTSMRRIFQDAYPPAFANADLVCISTPSKLDKVPEQERISAAQLSADITDAGVTARQFDTTDQIIEFLCEGARPGDTVLVMSNGGFDEIHTRLLDALGSST